MVLQFVGEYVVAFLLKTPFLTRTGFFVFTEIRQYAFDTL